MSVREQIAQILFRLGIDEGHKGVPPKSSIAADAIMPIVERAVKEAAWEGANEHATNGRTTMSAIDAIVARVMGDEAN